MTKSMNLSHKDNKYFIDGHVYNCPFCNRKNVKYEVVGNGSFFWSHEKVVYYFLVKCSDTGCGKVSFHLSDYDICVRFRSFSIPLQHIKTFEDEDNEGHVFSICDDIEIQEESFDDCFFYHQPSSFFTLDDRIPSVIRKPLNEADNCLKGNFLTGASGCLRKAIYMLLKYAKIPEKEQDLFLNYKDRLLLLKKSYPLVEDILFDHLEAVHGLASQELHENHWDDLDAKTLRFLLAVTKEVLEEIFVTPIEKEKRRQTLLELKSQAKK